MRPAAATASLPATPVVLLASWVPLAVAVGVVARWPVPSLDAWGASAAASLEPWDAVMRSTCRGGGKEERGHQADVQQKKHILMSVPSLSLENPTLSGQFTALWSHQLMQRGQRPLLGVAPAPLPPHALEVTSGTDLQWDEMT